MKWVDIKFILRVRTLIKFLSICMYATDFSFFQYVTIKIKFNNLNNIFFKDKIWFTSLQTEIMSESGWVSSNATKNV